MLTTEGLDTEILQIRWPSGVIPAQLSNFETIARRERYRILARAAIRNNIRSLYLGHHQDDQVETFIMRLAGSEGGGRVPPSTSLLGMRRSASIPCCEDIYGAYEDSYSGHPDEGTVSIAHAGLQLARPFLAYTKARLRATCEEMEVPYIMDETNLEPTSTRRNAIRHLLTTRKLPRALQRSCLVQSQVRLKEKVRTSILIPASALWSLLKVQNFDVRSGSLSIQFPKQSQLGSEEECFAAITHVMTQLLDAVSPRPRGPIVISADIVKSTIEALFQVASAHQMFNQKSYVRTVAGVLIEPSQRVLRLSREPIRSIEQSELLRAFVAAPQAGPAEGPLWTEWLFWDFRYWLRIKLVQSEHIDDYAVRAYTRADVASVYSRLRIISSKAVQNFQDLIESAATGRTRFTLPVITRRGLVISFPTLNISLPDSTGHNWEDCGLLSKPWQIRYKTQSVELRLACVRDGLNSTKTGVLRE
jgi:tRNA(Ile)-lysidine synthase